MQVDLDDPNTVLWLQQALPRVLAWRTYIDPTGEYDQPTRKGVTNFQTMNGIPATGEPDAATVARIEHELAVLDSQPYKKKRLPETSRPPFKPGDPVR